MQLSKIEFVADWQRVMGSDTALNTDTVLEYINLRAQADAGPVGDESQMPRVHGVSRIADNPCSVLVMLMAEPSDDALREIHDRLRAQSGQRAGVAEGAIEAAAKKLAEDFDYPWEHMPAKGKEDFRAKVRSIVAMLDAAPTQQQEGGK